MIKGKDFKLKIVKQRFFNQVGEIVKQEKEQDSPAEEQQTLNTNDLKGGLKKDGSITTINK